MINVAVEEDCNGRLDVCASGLISFQRVVIFYSSSSANGQSAFFVVVFLGVQLCVKLFSLCLYW